MNRVRIASGNAGNSSEFFCNVCAARHRSLPWQNSIYRGRKNRMGHLSEKCAGQGQHASVASGLPAI